MHGSSLTYAWLSDGTKVAAKADDGSGHGVVKRYLGSFVYTTSGGSSTEDLEQSDYLPYGTKIQNPNHAAGMHNRWRYAGKEEQRFGLAGAFSPIGNAPFGGIGFLDLSLLDFGARMYDPFTARWTAVDPLAKACVPISPFVYCASNPIIVRDSDGNIIETVLDVASLAMGIKSFVSNVKQGNVGAAILDGVGIVADAVAVATPFVPGGVGAGIKAIRAGDKIADVIKGAENASDAAKGIIVAGRNADNTVNAARNVVKTTESAKGGSKIVVSAENKIDRSILNAPDKPGNAPTFKSDGTKVEIHHVGQNPQGPFKEMHWSDHRGKGHYKENHPQNNSNIDRKQFDAQKKEYWKNEFRKND